MLVALRPLAVSFLSAALLGAACGNGGQPAAGGVGQKPAGTGEAIARIGSSVLTIDEVQKKMDDQSPFVRARYADPARKKEFLDAQVRFEVLAEEALSRGYHNDPEVQDAVRKIIVQKLTREEFDSRVRLADVTDAELQQYYDSHKSDYDKPEMARASVLIAEAKGGDKAAIQKLEGLRREAAELKNREDRNHFRDLVQKHSADEASKATGGDLRYLSQVEFTERFGKEAADWIFGGDTNNEISPVFVLGDQAAVFKRTGRRKAVTRSFEQVKNQIKNVVYREKRSAAFNTYVDELKKKFNVTVHEEKIDRIRVDTSVPPANPFDDGHGHGGHGGHGGHMDTGDTGDE
jgi:peptidyl-prolyl cis-trans isomerase C